MKIQSTVFAIAIMALFPIAASAQGFNNININLNDVMVGQRMQEMASRLDQANAASAFTVKKHNKKHDKQNRDHKMAAVQQDDSANANTLGAVSAVAAPAAQDNIATSSHQ